MFSANFIHHQTIYSQSCIFTHSRSFLLLFSYIGTCHGVISAHVMELYRHTSWSYIGTCHGVISAHVMELYRHICHGVFCKKIYYIYDFSLKRNDCWRYHWNPTQLGWSAEQRIMILGVGILSLGHRKPRQSPILLELIERREIILNVTSRSEIMFKHNSLV